jgi:uncharacterized Zn finger protein
MPVGPDGWFDAAKPIAVEGGIKARTARGRIGQHWWSRRFIDILEGICDGGRLARGRAYARKGQVLDIDLRPAVVTARVQGSRPTPYKIKIQIEGYGDAAWALIQEALAAQALYRAKLLAGEMPTEIEAVFESVGLPLFPHQFDMECTCPDWGFPCKHLSAVLYLLAEAFDEDPFLVLAWRGRAREDLLDTLRGLGENADDAVDPLAVADEPLDRRLSDFYTPAVSLARLRQRNTGVAAPPELLLRALEPPSVKARHIPLVDLLRPVYRNLPSVMDAPGDPPQGDGPAVVA